MNPNTGRVELAVDLKTSDLYLLYLIHAAYKSRLATGYVTLGLLILMAIARQRLGFLLLLVLPPVSVLVFASILYYIFVRPYLAARSIVQRSSALWPVTRYSFDEAGVQVNGAVYNWEAVLRAKQTSRLIVLYLSEPLSFVLPKRCFESPERLNQFKALLIRNVVKRPAIPADKSQPSKAGQTL